MPLTKEDIKIKTVASNTMKLDEVYISAKTPDTATRSEKELAWDQADKLFGDRSPLILINGYNITRYLSYFDMDMNGFMPTIRFTFSALDPVFLSVSYPKDGDIVSVYIKSSIEVYKPLRMDFNVLSVSSELTSKYSDTGSDSIGLGKNLVFNILAECRVPGIYTHRSKSFPSSTSYDALLQIAQDLDLGFSVNDSSVTDRMTWICPNYSYYDFVKEITESSYKDDSSFFYSFIDCYYNLNFVNLGNQFGYEEDLAKNPDIVMALPGGSDGYKPDTTFPGAVNPETKQVKLIITNFYFGGTYPFSINGYTLISNTGQKSNKTGYFTRILFYDEAAEVDNLEEKVVSYDIESSTPETVQDGEILQKGRPAETIYLEERRIEWLGVMNEYSEGNPGVHSNYLHAQFQNVMNMEDATKLTLRAELDSYYPGIYRGQVVPVEIFVYDSTGNRKSNTGTLDNGSSDTSGGNLRDNFLSGNYVVVGMNITYDASRGMKQVLNLCRRTWKINTSGQSQKTSPSQSGVG
jgi:hypothetical protein